MSVKKTASVLLIVIFIFSAYFSSLAQACEESADNNKCKCYLTVKVPEHKLTLGKKQNTNAPVLFIKNETIKPVNLVFKKGTKIVREFCVNSCAEETVIMDAGKYKYEITGCAVKKGVIKGVHTFTKGNNYNWAINAEFAGYNTITKQICVPGHECMPECKCAKCKPVCKPKCDDNCKSACKSECDGNCKTMCLPAVKCIPVIKVKPISAPIISEPVEINPVKCVPVSMCKSANICPICGTLHKHAKKHHHAFYCKSFDSADRTFKYFSHKPCLMCLEPVKTVEDGSKEKSAATKIENAYIEMLNQSNECVTYLISGPGVSKKIDLKPCSNVALEVLPGKYAVVANVNGVMSPMQSLTIAAGQKVEVKY